MGMEIEWEVAESRCPACSAARPRRLCLAGSGGALAYDRWRWQRLRDRVCQQRGWGYGGGCLTARVLARPHPMVVMFFCLAMMQWRKNVYFMIDRHMCWRFQISSNHVYILFYRLRADEIC